MALIKYWAHDDTVIKGDGIRIAESSNISVTDNKIVNAAANGIHIIDGYGLMTVGKNLINDSAMNGILAKSTVMTSPIDLCIVENAVSNGSAVQGFAAVNLDIGGSGTAA